MAWCIRASPFFHFCQALQVEYSTAPAAVAIKKCPIHFIGLEGGGAGDSFLL